MLTHRLIHVSAVAAVLSLSAVAAPALAYPGQQLAAKAHMTLAQARAIAIHTLPGTIVDQELEREPGGSGLRYTFGVKVGSARFEVGVDAMSGRVLEKMREGKHPD